MGISQREPNEILVKDIVLTYEQEKATHISNFWMGVREKRQEG